MPHSNRRRKNEARAPPLGPPQVASHLRSQERGDALLGLEFDGRQNAYRFWVTRWKTISPRKTLCGTYICVCLSFFLGDSLSTPSLIPNHRLIRLPNHGGGGGGGPSVSAGESPSLPLAQILLAGCLVVLDPAVCWSGSVRDHFVLEPTVASHPPRGWWG